MHFSGVLIYRKYIKCVVCSNMRLTTRVFVCGACIQCVNAFVWVDSDFTNGWSMRSACLNSQHIWRQTYIDAITCECVFVSFMCWCWFFFYFRVYLLRPVIVGNECCATISIWMNASLAYYLSVRYACATLFLFACVWGALRVRFVFELNLPDFVEKCVNCVSHYCCLGVGLDEGGIFLCGGTTTSTERQYVFFLHTHNTNNDNDNSNQLYKYI